MPKYPGLELPIRSKLIMLEEMALVIRYLHKGNRKAIRPLLDDLKLRSIYLEEPIQNSVLIFSEQVDFQLDYDPWHKVTPDVEKAADRLIEALGFENRPSFLHFHSRDRS